MYARKHTHTHTYTYWQVKSRRVTWSSAQSTLCAGIVAAAYLAHVQILSATVFFCAGLKVDGLAEFEALICNGQFSFVFDSWGMAKVAGVSCAHLRVGAAKDHTMRQKNSPRCSQ